MRETLGRHIDLVVVIWVLTLALGWSVLALSRAQLSADQWSSAPQSGAAWSSRAATPRSSGLSDQAWAGACSRSPKRIICAAVS